MSTWRQTVWSTTTLTMTSNNNRCKLLLFETLWKDVTFVICWRKFSWIATLRVCRDDDRCLDVVERCTLTMSWKRWCRCRRDVGVDVMSMSTDDVVKTIVDVDWRCRLRCRCRLAIRSWTDVTISYFVALKQIVVKIN